MSDNYTSHRSISFVPWFTVYFLIKWFGTVLAAWSWWWLLLPWVPCLWLLLHKLGVIS